MKPDDVVQATRSWLGTPYHHQASVQGVGCDCLGLLRGVWRELLGDEPEVMPPYSPSWDEVNPDELMLRACEQYLEPLDPSARGPGTVLVFRMVRLSVAKHCAIMSSPVTMIHAKERLGVVEATLSKRWSDRVAGAYRFPGVS